MASERVAVRGSERRLVPNAQVVGTPEPTQSIAVTLILRRRAELASVPAAARLTREEFEERYGAGPDDIRMVEQFAAANDLTVVETEPARRTVVLAGTVANMNEAFGTQLRLFQSPDGLFRGRTGELYLPPDLAAVVTGVFGLDERPQARTRFRRWSARPKAAGDTSYTPNQVANLYTFPAGTGAGQTVAIIELGGGYRTADLNTYFKGLGVAIPSVTAVSVDGAQNQPEGDPNGADGEVLLDIEVVGAIAPSARIAVYFAPNTDQGFLDAITTAVHDKVRKPSAISISWGGAESSWTQQALTSFDQAFQDAGVLGVTICCASGDDGSTDGVSDGTAHVDFPASSPNVLACGGTRLESSANAITREVVWNDGPGNGASGGGVSETFPLPSYQAKAGVPASVNPSRHAGRGVPDVSGNADPATGYQVYVDGRDAIYGGTSAVAPLWAGLITLINEQAGKPAGWVNGALYTARTNKGALRDITSGDNGAYAAKPGWDACTGLGSPDGKALLDLLRGEAGSPQHHHRT